MSSRTLLVAMSITLAVALAQFALVLLRNRVRHRLYPTASPAVQLHPPTSATPTSEVTEVRPTTSARP